MGGGTVRVVAHPDGGAPDAGPAKSGGSVIVVAKPDVPPGYDTDRIALMFEQGHRLDYYAGAAWSGRLSDLLQTFIAQSARRDLHSRRRTLDEVLARRFGVHRAVRPHLHG